MTCKGRETDCRVACAPRNDRVWISVKDKLPENGRKVLYLKPCEWLPDDPVIDTCTYYEGFNCFLGDVDVDKSHEIKGVTHWMLLPEPPAKPKVEWLRKNDVLRICPTLPRSEEVREAWKISDGMALNMGDYLAGWSDGVAAYMDAVRRMVGEEIEDD